MKRAPYEEDARKIVLACKKKEIAGCIAAHSVLKIYHAAALQENRRKGKVKKEALAMLEIVDGKEKISATKVREDYPNCHYILVDINDDLQDLEGRLYCVSYSHDSYRKLCSIADDLEENGVPFAHLGFYDDGHAVGIQYEIKDGRI